MIIKNMDNFFIKGKTIFFNIDFKDTICDKYLLECSNPNIKKIVFSNNFIESLEPLANCNNIETIYFETYMESIVRKAQDIKEKDNNKDFHDILDSLINISTPSFNKYTVQWPKNLKKLTIRSDDFNQPLDNLPDIAYIKLYIPNFRLQLNHLPDKLQKLSLDCFTGNLSVFPNNLKELELTNFTGSIENLPNFLEILSIINSDCLIDLENLPRRLRRLRLDITLKKSLDNLPIQLKVLDLSNACYNFSLDNLPNSITYLNLNNIYFDQCLDNLPAMLKVLKLGNNFNRELNNLPRKIKKVLIPVNGRFDKEIKNIPKSLLKITVPKKYPYIDSIRKLKINIQENFF